VRKIEPGRWVFQQNGRSKLLREMASFETEDIADDIRWMLSRLAAHGIERVLAADLSEPGGFAVVRVMAPGLEFWALDRGKIGPRALDFWRRHAL
jgi:ribosomal protein S12 methylthiotransferase accessory factor